MNHSPSRSIIAVNSLCMAEAFYRERRRSMADGRPNARVTDKRRTCRGLPPHALRRDNIDEIDAADAIAEATELRTLEQVFRWRLSRQRRFTPGDLVVQDEYTT